MMMSGMNIGGRTARIFDPPRLLKASSRRRPITPRKMSLLFKLLLYEKAVASYALYSGQPNTKPSAHSELIRTLILHSIVYTNLKKKIMFRINKKLD